MDRRGFLRGLAGCFAAAAAPAVLPSGIIMPVRQIVVPPPIMPMGIGTWEDVRFIESSDHSVDAMRYMIASRMQLTREMVRYAVLKARPARAINGNYAGIVHPDNRQMWSEYKRLARG